MNVNAQSILGVTLILVALVVILRDPTGTNMIITGIADGYARSVRALQGNA